MVTPRIAVIDHDPIFLNLMHELLADEGYEAICWHADEDTFARLQEAQPVLVILDIVVHQRDAVWALMERLHDDPTTARIPVIVCTADVSYVREKAADFLEYGYAVVEKPFMLENLLAQIHRLLASSGSPLPVTGETAMR